MHTRSIWANLGVDDLQRTTNFYTAIGFKPNGVSADLTSFKVGDDNFVIHFFLNEKLKEGMHGPLANLQHGNEIVFTLGAENKKVVDDWAVEVREAGGIIISAPEEFGNDYYGFVFADPDGHRFNVFYMEGLY
jgi:uncharacterized protein